MDNIFESIIAAVGLVVVFIAFVFIFGLLVALPLMWLWNSVGVAVLGLKAVSFWQAWGLLILSGILFNSHNVNPSK